MKFICIFFTIYATLTLAKREPKRPVWAPQYKVSWNFTVPYVSEYQESGLVYHYEAFQDYENAIQKVVRDDVETVIINVQEDTMYEIFPAQDKYLCWVGAVHGGTGPTRRRRRTNRKLAMAGVPTTSTSTTSEQQQVHLRSNDDPDDPPPQEYLGFVLPDLTEHRWKYVGKEKYPHHRHQELQASSISSSSTLEADVWEWDLTEGDMEMKYRFYTDSNTNHPLVLDMIGINLYTGGHKDHYIAHYYNYEEILPSPSDIGGGGGGGGNGFPEGTFDPPVDIECTDAEPDAANREEEAAADPTRTASKTTTVTNLSSSPQKRSSTLFRSFMRHILPSVHWGINPHYDSFMHRHGRRHATKEEYQTRHQYFKTSKEFVDSWNAVGDSTTSTINDETNSAETNAKNAPRQKHRVALNKFADWSREEYRSLLGLKRKKEKKGVMPDRYVATVENFTSTPHFLPAQVIWKGTPADSPVKDQAACGSCWAFSSAASLEAAVYRTTGTQTLLSEQEIMDCGWEAPGSNTGCMGGDQDSALIWALQRGGVAALADYPYKGVNDFCRSSSSDNDINNSTNASNSSNTEIYNSEKSSTASTTTTSTPHSQINKVNKVNRVPINGKLVVVKGGEQALQAALLSQGPMAVSVDAEADDFRFYAGGVYSNPECATAAADLNHAVIVSGYGVDAESGKPIWLVKNIWSKYWGEDGYIRIVREPNDCGIATEPMYVATDDM